eukprot:CAMPEP_0197698686 /NCGR_PEP_ID=MMETSP1338-20131121/119624_1 /TAXON_ID=43686 ORGANISM="Pelagodinium beii, Strain RCC1491" /NCGR_SAMPLE_ID=MMETSP1338 /ASSEMBLY_ACC=CAM_ASM_000754 /LENGTH=284 /DNA_ID=CAMNT_0043282103 /DNA_START=92 /DNA_END=943 /DNA_ORIENTATION=-
MQVEVLRGEAANSVTRRLAARVFVYCTDPEAEEDADPDPEDGPLYDPSCVWLASDPGQITDDALACRGCLSCPWPASENLLKAKFGSKNIAALELHPARHESGRAGAATPSESSSSDPCPFAGIRLSGSRSDFLWQPKEPSPLAERTAELGGCELLRLMTCPVALGFFKPSATVYCANGSRYDLPLSEYGKVDALRSKMAELLQVADDVKLRLVFADRDNMEVTRENLDPKSKNGFLPAPMALLCGVGDLTAAKRLYEARSEEAVREPGPEADDKLQVLDLEIL